MLFKPLVPDNSVNVEKHFPTASLPGIAAAVSVENPGPKNNYFTIVTLGEVVIHYTGQASMHVWLSYYAEMPS